MRAEAPDVAAPVPSATPGTKPINPNAPRPFKALGYPIAPAIFTIACFVILANALYTDLVKPMTAGTPIGPSAWGFLVIGLGLPVYYFFARRK